MKDYEAKAVIESLLTGRDFTFESYSADAREVLTYDRATSCFVLTRQHAYDTDNTDRRLFSQQELAAWLMNTFAYQVFGLPPARQDAGS